jgi:hypothetical protein
VPALLVVVALLGVERIALKLAAAMELNGTAEPGSRHCESVLSLAFFVRIFGSGPSA